MLSNLENQLKEQGASDKIDDVLKEIQVVQKDCGYIPLVTPTSQIVGTQAVFNVLFGRYAKLTQETRDLVTGKYGKTPAPVNEDLLKESLKQNEMDAAVTCRPADNIPNEWDKMVEEAKANGGNGSEEDTLTYAMFPKVAPKFFEKRRDRKYQVEFNMNRLQDYEDDTSIDDYDIKWEVTDSWRNILQSKKEIAEEKMIESRIAYLEEKQQEKLAELTLQEVRNCRIGQKRSPEFYEFISTQSGSDVYSNIKTISKRWNKSFKAIWRAWKFMYGVHELEELYYK